MYKAYVSKASRSRCVCYLEDWYEQSGGQGPAVSDAVYGWRSCNGSHVDDMLLVVVHMHNCSELWSLECTIQSLLDYLSRHAVLD